MSTLLLIVIIEGEDDVDDTEVDDVDDEIMDSIRLLIRFNSC